MNVRIIEKERPVADDIPRGPVAGEEPPVYVDEAFLGAIAEESAHAAELERAGHEMVAAQFGEFTAREAALRGQPWWDKPSAVITHPYPDPGVTAFNEEVFAGTEAPAAAPCTLPVFIAIQAAGPEAEQGGSASPPAAEPETPDPAPTAVIEPAKAETEVFPAATDDGGESNG